MFQEEESWRQSKTPFFPFFFYKFPLTLLYSLLPHVQRWRCSWWRYPWQGSSKNLGTCSSKAIVWISNQFGRSSPTFTWDLQKKIMFEEMIVLKHLKRPFRSPRQRVSILFLLEVEEFCCLALNRLGDLFHQNRPSRSTLHKCMTLLVRFRLIIPPIKT